MLFVFGRFGIEEIILQLSFVNLLIPFPSEPKINTYLSFLEILPIISFILWEAL